MKTKQKLTAALCALALALSLTPPALAADGPARTDNWLKNDYDDYSERSHSWLYANPGGGLTRVEDVPYGDSILIEDYSGSFHLLSGRTLPKELEGFLGFFSGSQYNYLFYGANNRAENDGAEVFRAVKYSKSWERLGQGSVYGANTNSWSGGPLRCAEAGGMLYVHASRTMYKSTSSDGLNHQANILMAFRTSDMTATEQNCTAAYVSHSLNQYILASQGGDLILTNHGDSYPRALVLHRLEGKAGAERLGGGQVTEVQTPEFRGGGSTWTKLGGVAETSSGYVMAFAQRENCEIFNPYDLNLAYISKADFSLRTTTLTHYRADDGGATIPMVVPTGLDGGWLLWNQRKWTKDGNLNNGFSYARYAADGSVGERKTLPDVALSDCQPILYNGKVVWYTTHDSAPVFYTLDASGVTATPAGGSAQAVQPAAQPGTQPGTSGGGQFRDVPANHWASQDIAQCVASGAVAGFGDGTFRPEDTVTIPQFIVMLERVFYPDQLAEAQKKYAGKPWHVPVFQAARSRILHYLETELETHDAVKNGWADFKDAPIDRFTMAMMAANVLQDRTRYISSKDCEPALAAISDYSSSWSIPGQLGVPICLQYGIMTGMPDGTFSGTRTVTRAQACAVLNRLSAAVDNYG